MVIRSNRFCSFFLGREQLSRKGMIVIMEAWLLRLFNDLRTIGIGDVLDVLVIAFVIYRLLSSVRKTSTGNVIKGIVVIVAVLVLSNIFHLNVVNYLTGQVMQMAVIILIMLFQPEIRRLLEQAGNTNRIGLLFGPRSSGGDIEAIIDVVVSAFTDMAHSKTGALLVFERTLGLGDYAATGTPVNSLISAELIKSIFFPNTPLHDGAVLIQDNRILAAGCMLPMSTNPALSRDLGMRHKAGIGMSERSDAVVVISSEETGTISVAIDGMLKRRLDTETFRALLLQELVGDTDGKRKSRRRGGKEK